MGGGRDYMYAAEASVAGVWMAVDCSGREIVADVDKQAIMRRTQIRARDLRILDPLLSNSSTILAGERAILLNLEHIKAIISSQEVLLHNPLDDNVVPIVEELRRRLNKVNGDNKNVESGEEDDSPFEFKFIEVALEAICSFFDARTVELETAVYPALDMLTSKICGRNFDRVRKLRSQLIKLTARVQRVRDELGNLLDDDDDMANFYLSKKLGGASPTIGSMVHGDENDVEELEMLLEVYFNQIDSTFNKLTRLREYIKSTIDCAKMQQHSNRNNLIQLELFLNAANLCVQMYSLVAAIFGMNIPYTWNDGHGYTFKWVVIVGGIFSAVAFIVIISYARYKGIIGTKLN